MDPQDLFPASYRGVPFLVQSTSIAGGRKVVTKRFVNSDDQLVEDLGLLQRGFTVSGIVAPQFDGNGGEIRSYQTVRDALLEALELGGVGILVHPFLGRLENIVATSYTFNEDTRRLGDSSIEITFAVSNTDGVPEPAENVLAGVVAANTATAAAVDVDVADRFTVTEFFTSNFTDALDKIDQIVDEINEATSPLAIEADALDEFNAELTAVSTNAASLVGNPTDLADSIVGLYLTMNGLYTTATGTFDAFRRLFDFGDDDTAIPQTTAGRIERQENRSVINAAMQSLALSYCYENAAQLPLSTTDEIDQVQEVLEDQYQKVLNSGTLDSSVEEELTKTRIVTVNFLQDLRVTRPRVIEVKTELTSSRLLAFQYYGSSELGDTIARLNGLNDPACLQGTVEILSE